jgi:hypothetical protein
VRQRVPGKNRARPSSPVTRLIERGSGSSCPRFVLVEVRQSLVIARQGSATSVAVCMTVYSRGQNKHGRKPDELAEQQHPVLPLSANDLVFRALRRLANGLRAACASLARTAWVTPAQGSKSASVGAFHLVLHGRSFSASPRNRRQGLSRLVTQRPCARLPAIFIKASTPPPSVMRSILGAGCGRAATLTRGVFALRRQAWCSDGRFETP